MLCIAWQWVPLLSLALLCIALHCIAVGYCHMRTRSILGSIRLVPDRIAVLTSLLMATAPETTSSVGKPAHTLLPLSHLNEQSARVGRWEVFIWKPKDISHEYMWENKKRSTYGMQCTLVSTKDPKQYVLADSHGKGMSAEKTKTLLAKFKEGLVFTMSKVVLAENSKRQFNSAPKTEVVCIRQTKFDPVLAGSAGKSVMPEPPVPISASMNINREQHFDVLALIHDISELSAGGQLKNGQARSRFTVTLSDGSTMKNEEQPRLLPVTIFLDTPKDGSVPTDYQKLDEAGNQKKAIAFFGVQGKKSPSEDTWSFQSGFSFTWYTASNTEKGRRLEAEAEQVLSQASELVPKTVLKSRTIDFESYADEEATETTCALLKTLLANTNLAALEVEASFWQINGCRVYLPEAAKKQKPEVQELCSADATRLWFQVKVEDETGHITLYIREKAALALAAVDSKEAFENAIVAETLCFPNQASIKIIRKSPGVQTPTAKDTSVDKPGEDDSQSQVNEVRCYIVEAAEQDMRCSPSKRSFDLMSLLSMTDPDTNSCLPAVLSNITKDPHYGLLVSCALDGKTVVKQCTKALALGIACKPTQSDNLNEGYRMVTQGVQDPFTEGFACDLLSYCTVTSSPDYQLKPNRGQKSQMAFLCIVDVLEAGERPVFLVENLQKVDDCDATLAKEYMSKRLRFAAMTTQMQGSSTSRQWTEAVSPAAAGKCRKIGKAPSTPV